MKETQKKANLILSRKCPLRKRIRSVKVNQAQLEVPQIKEMKDLKRFQSLISKVSCLGVGSANQWLYNSKMNKVVCLKSRF